MEPPSISPVVEEGDIELSEGVSGAWRERRRRAESEEGDGKRVERDVFEEVLVTTVDQSDGLHGRRESLEELATSRSCQELHRIVLSRRVHQGESNMAEAVGIEVGNDEVGSGEAEAEGDPRERRAGVAGAS